MYLKVINSGSKHGNSYALFSDSGEILILDAGCKYKDILRVIDYRISDVCGVLISHIHGDHTLSFKDFLRAGIEVYSNDETQSELEQVTGERIKGVLKNNKFLCGKFKVTPFYIPHTRTSAETNELIPCKNYGYLIEHEEMGKLLYMTDMEHCPYRFKSYKVNHMMIECNYMDELVNKDEPNFLHRIEGHCSLDTCKEIVKENSSNDLLNVILIHLSHSSCNPQIASEEIKAIVGMGVYVNIAKAGLTVNINRVPF